MDKVIQIGNRIVGEGHPTYIIAEMSANHAGSIERAKEIIHAAKEAGADCIKIQTYTPDTLTIDCHNEYFDVKNGTWEGENLYSLYGKAYTPWEWQQELKAEAEKCGIDFLSTPFDNTAVDFLDAMGMAFYKIASFEMIDLPLLKYVASKGKPIIMSTGMATKEEIKEAINAIYETGNTQVAIMKCSSAYPAVTEDMNLVTIRDMIDKFQVPVGLSDHSMGHFSAVTAVALGACIIEKHFCMSRKIENPDASFSMTPAEFKEMVERVRETEAALGKVKYGISKQEEASVVFRRSIFAVKDIKKGEAFTEENVRIIRPGYGVKPKYIDDVLSMRAAVDMKRGTPLAFNCVEKGAILFLTNNENTDKVYRFLQTKEKLVYKFGNKLNLDIIKELEPEYVVSFNYRHIVPKDVIDYMKGRIINLHCSYLPYNRGSSPNFFSFYENTKKGVTIHELSEGLDTGAIYCQRELEFDETKETFASSYDKLMDAMYDLFINNWDFIKNKKITPVTQQEEGTYHTMKDLSKIRDEVPFSWNECVAAVKQRLFKCVLIRTDANNEIGAGHVMRCLAVADSLKNDYNVDPVFVVSDDNAVSLIEGRGHRYVILHSDYRKLAEQNEINRMMQLLNQHLPTAVLVDSYQVNGQYFDMLKKEVSGMEAFKETPVRWFYMDDIRQPDYAVDGIINYNIYADKLSYDQPIKLIGADYAPLNPVYGKNNGTRREVACKVSDALITSGGADKYNVCYEMAKRLAPEYPDVCFHVVSGAYNTHLNDLLELARKYSNVKVEQNVKNMKALQEVCDIAVSSAGSTMYELAVLGVPTITYYFVDNQKMIAEAFAEKACIENAGDYSKDSGKVLERIDEAFETLAASYVARKMASNNMKSVTDGFGAKRIAGALIGYEKES